MGSTTHPFGHTRCEIIGDVVAFGWIFRSGDIVQGNLMLKRWTTGEILLVRVFYQNI